MAFYGMWFCVLGFMQLQMIQAKIKANGTMEHAQLLKDLLSDYDNMVRPVNETTKVTSVSIRPTLYQIRELDEKNQYLTTNLWLRFFWKDDFLQWDPSDYKGLRRLHILSSKIWRPDIVLYNSVDEERSASDLLPNTNVEVSPDGMVSWTTPVMLKSACKIRVDNYPFDIQHCPLKFGSWTFHGEEINITLAVDSVLMDNFLTNGEWVLLEAPCKRNEVYYSCCPEPFPDVTCTIVMRRRPLFYMYNLVFPCALMIVLGAMVFCLPPESGEKISLAMTVLLTMTVFMLVVMENIPPTSEVVPLLEQFIGGTMALLTMSAMTAIIVLNVYFKGDSHQQRPPLWTRRLVLDWLACLVFMRKSGKKQHLMNKFRRKMSEQQAGYTDCLMHSMTSRAPEVEHENQLSSANDNNSSAAMSNAVINNSTSFSNKNSHTNNTEQSQQQQQQQQQQQMHNSETIYILKAMLCRLDQIVEREGSVNCQGSFRGPSAACDITYATPRSRIQFEWREIALVLDRLFLVLFVFLTITMVICIIIFSQIEHGV